MRYAAVGSTLEKLPFVQDVGQNAPRGDKKYTMCVLTKKFWSECILSNACLVKRPSDHSWLFVNNIELCELCLIKVGDIRNIVLPFNLGGNYISAWCTN
jgi:hypothetical protein